MATGKPYHARKTSVTFGKPTVGPKVYLVKGQSGWPETYARKVADKALSDFLNPLNVTDVLAAFTVSMTLEAREETWGDVLGYLGKITDTSEKTLPEIVGVAFWALYLISKQLEGTN